ncbi:hypothetical protein D3C75_792060 [compost metagenome]
MCSFAQRHRLLEQPIEPSSSYTLSLSCEKRTPHLSQDLRLPNHHGIQAASHAEQMRNRLFVFINIHMLSKLLAFHTKPLLHKAADEITSHMKAVHHHINFRTVASSY